MPDQAGDMTKATTVLAEDVEINGTVTFKNSLMINGIVEGQIISEGLLIVSSTAKVTATITTKNLVSYGKITGNVKASEQIALKAASVLEGDLATSQIVIETGAILNGSITMNKQGK
jgi:cytoskeletal protein CcmA (bactofilin family)